MKGVRMTLLEEGKMRRQLARLERGELLTQEERRTREGQIAMLTARLAANDRAQARDARKGRHVRYR